MYVHGTYMVCTFRAINMYVHSSDVYVHVYTFTYTVHTMYKHVYARFV